MRIEFTGKTNRDYCMVNTAIFKLSDGREVTVDRDNTRYMIKDVELEMLWIDCYIWSDDEADYKIDANLFNGAEFIGFELEDDADADYEISCVKYVIL